MADSRSDTVYFDHGKSSEQFDYFIMGLISAIVAYLAQNITAGSFTSLSYDINLLAMSSLLLSMYCWFIRIEQVIFGKMLNHLMLHAAETRGKLIAFLADNPDSQAYLNTETGEKHTREQTEEQINRYAGEMIHGRPRIEAAKAKASFYYNARNRLFMIGFVGIIAAKVLSPYVG